MSPAVPPIEVSPNALSAKGIETVLIGNTVTLKQPGTWIHTQYDKQGFRRVKLCRADGCFFKSGKWRIEDRGELCQKVTSVYTGKTKDTCYQVVYSEEAKVIFHLISENSEKVAAKKFVLEWEPGDQLPFKKP